ncbi:MAG: histidine phosphatase family protein [Thermodesulfobacteriota bacterium]
MSVLYLVRHGQASFGEANYDKLSALGERQAGITAGFFAGLPKPVDTVICGRMVRHRQTADPFCRTAPREPLIREHFDEFDGLAAWVEDVGKMAKADAAVAEDLKNVLADERAFSRVLQKALRRFVEGYADPKLAALWAAFTQRVREGMQSIMAGFGPGAQVVVYTSAGPVAAAVQMALSLSDAKAMELAFQVKNASVTAFRYNEQGMVLSSFNEVGHLFAEKDNTLITYR